MNEERSPHGHRQPSPPFRGEEFFLGDGAYTPLARSLSQFDARSTITRAGGLLSVPEYHPATIRIELLLHLTCIHCRGDKRPTFKDFKRWLHSMLGNTPLKLLEDPPEDVFVSNVIGPGGNYRIFEGIWEQNDYYLQDVVYCLFRTRRAARFRALWPPIGALLKLSDAVADRSRVGRWSVSSEQVPERVFLRESPSLGEAAARITFRRNDLEAMGVDEEDLGPFCLSPSLRSALGRETLGHTSLERYPVIAFEDSFVLACPTAVSAAVRRFVIENVSEAGALASFEESLRALQHHALFRSALPRVSDEGRPLSTDLPSDVPHPDGVSLADSAICAFDFDKLAHVVLLHDAVSEISESGVAGMAVLPEDVSSRFADYLRGSVEELRKHTEDGMTLVVRGGLGRGVALGLPRFPDDWPVAMVDLPSFTQFAWSTDTSLLRLWKLYRQVSKVGENGVFVPFHFGPLNVHAYWASEEYQLVPTEFPYPTEHGMIYVTADHVRDIRVRERVVQEIHAAAIDSEGGTLRVRRFYHDSHFETLQLRPIFVSEEHVGQGRLVGVVESQRFNLWVWADRPDVEGGAVGFVYHVWEALLSWLDRLLPLINPLLGVETGPPFHVHVELDDAESWRRFDTEAGTGDEAAPVVRRDDGDQTLVHVSLPFGFVSMVRRPANDAERVLLELTCGALLDALAELELVASGSDTADQARGFVADCMGSEDSRSLHLFETTEVADRLVGGRQPSPRFAQAEDKAEWATGLGWRHLARPTTEEERPQPLELTGSEQCKGLVNALVEVVWTDVRARLRELDAESLIEFVLKNNEAIAYDRRWWHRTARALIALRSGEEDVEAVASRRESNRAEAMNAGRILVEMAICTSRVGSGLPASHATVDSLLAGVSQLLELASDSDAIHGGFVPAVTVFPNGKIVCDRSAVAEVMNPFAMEQHAADFREAAADYDTLYTGLTRGAGAGSRLRLDDEEFTTAFEAEFGLQPSRLIDGAAELLDLAVEGTSMVVSTTRGVVEQRLRSTRRFSSEEVDAFFAMLALIPRKRWDAAPPGFLARDWQPWRFRRRLSLVARPLVTLGVDESARLLYGVHNLGASVSYLIETVESAWLPGEYFRSERMRRYCGHRADEEGQAFTEEVARVLRTDEWLDKTNVSMSQLGAPAELGDVDVVAWRATGSKLLLIECKRLKPARTVGEVVEMLNEFKGEERDRLGRHVARCTWIADHLDEVLQRLGLSSDVSEAVPLLVTNREVPMQYTSELAIAPEQVIPLTKLTGSLRAFLGAI